MAPIPRLLVLLCGLMACGDTVADKVARYHAEMVPVMAENTRLANRFLGLAKAVHKEGREMDEVAASIREDVLPQAEGLRASIVAVEPELEELRDVHQQAVTAWTLQVEAYTEMMTAYQADDVAGFSEAQKKLGQAKVTAEGYVREVNRILGPYGYHLDEFPKVR